MPFPLGNFGWASGENKNVQSGSFFKQNNSLEKVPHLMEYITAYSHKRICIVPTLQLHQE